ncbi:MAG: hypothetical protein U0Y68_02225 [Blastocatellia bacterium]
MESKSAPGKVTADKEQAREPRALPGASRCCLGLMISAQRYYDKHIERQSSVARCRHQSVAQRSSDIGNGTVVLPRVPVTTGGAK